MSLPTNTERSRAQQQLEQIPVVVVAMTVDRCANTYGVAPCTASGAVGTECYNTYSTCQDKPNYIKDGHTYAFCSRGVPLPAGQPMRPYVVEMPKGAPAELDVNRGMSRRSQLRAVLVDETDNDTEQDPYYATRPSAPQGTFWTRWLARNPYYLGRRANIGRGFATLAADGKTLEWDWCTFAWELYLIDNIARDTHGQVEVTLKDFASLLDNAKIPPSTDGTLQADFKAVEQGGTVQSATGSTVTLSSKASATDGAYDGMEVYISGGTGAGQRRVIQSYTGASRQATLTADWAVTPNGTSTYEVAALSVDVGSGKGAQYSDKYGLPCVVRIGKELIKVTAVNGDVLSWPDNTYREIDGSPREDHSKDDAVQLCRRWDNAPFTQVIQDIINEGGIDDSLIDTAGLADQEVSKFGPNYYITATLHSPDKATSLLDDLLIPFHGGVYWDAQNQQMRLKIIGPELVAGTPEWSDDASFENIPKRDNLTDERITEYALRYNLQYPTINRREDVSYLGTDLGVDIEAEGANEYDGQKVDNVHYRWFGPANSTAARELAVRRRDRLRDAPVQLKAVITQKDNTAALGEQVAVTTEQVVDVTGAPKPTRMVVTRLDDTGGHVDVTLRTIGTEGKRWAFWAPNDAGAWPSDPDYMHWGNSAGQMPDGSDGYLWV